MMQHAQRPNGDVTIVDLAGRLRLDDGVDEFRALVHELIGNGQTRLVLNLAGCQYLDSAGLGELATALVRARNAGGQLVLLNPTERVQQLLAVTRLADVFAIHRNEQMALSAARGEAV